MFVFFNLFRNWKYFVSRFDYETTGAGLSLTFQFSTFQNAMPIYYPSPKNWNPAIPSLTPTVVFFVTSSIRVRDNRLKAVTWRWKTWTSVRYYHRGIFCTFRKRNKKKKRKKRMCVFLPPSSPDWPTRGTNWPRVLVTCRPRPPPRPPSTPERDLGQITRQLTTD